jgi:Reverse transcriptase (RNA-dependent DNA polymerase)
MYHEIESELSKKRDLKIRDQLYELKLGEVLHAEKPSAHFLDIAKTKTNQAGLNLIRNDKGTKFLNDTERGEYIRNFYAKLYGFTGTEGSIENFLGPGVCGHRLVENSKLTVPERVELDLDLNISELDKALDGANKKSAPGRDGYNNKIIKQLWPIFRLPLYSVAQYGLNNGNLPVDFLSADIKLIPKKENLESIRNWRPISLLSCFYKIISRAINNRLKKIAPRILSRAQKGFVPGRYMHEVLMNNLDRADFCRSREIEGVLISADLSKAFDSVSHEFMEKVYDFFCFGPRIKTWLKAIGTNRTARIILENSTYSDEFKLGKGHAQGDSPSPLLFNFAQQIMLFKIELSPEIKSIGREQIGPGQNRPEKFYEDECNGETDKCDGFADDNYTVTVLETGSVQSLFKFLDEFEKLTGLSCNKNKTTCLRIGCENNNVPTEILDLGLDWATEIKMLGFTFGNSNNIINKNFDTVSKKVKKIINYWNRFGLSIVGRITVIKSLVMPHIGFVGSILEPPENWISDTENIILKFAAGKK